MRSVSIFWRWSLFVPLTVLAVACGQSDGDSDGHDESLGSGSEGAGDGGGSGEGGTNGEGTGGGGAEEGIGESGGEEEEGGEGESEEGAAEEEETGAETGDEEGGESSGGGENLACGEAPSLEEAMPPAVGELLPRGELLRPDGEHWNMCEMGGQPFVFSVTAGWCGPCRGLAEELAGIRPPHSEEMEKMLKGLEEGRFGWLEIVIDENEGYGPVSAAFLQEWESMYPNEAVTLVGDDTEVGMSGAILQYTRPSFSSGLPQGGLVGEDYRWSTLGLLEAITAAANQL